MFFKKNINIWYLSFFEPQKLRDKIVKLVLSGTRTKKCYKMVIFHPKLIIINYIYSKGSEFNRRPCPFPTVFREGPFRSTAQRIVLFFTVFSDIYLKAPNLLRFKFYCSAVQTFILPIYQPFFVILTLKTLIRWNLLEKREPYRYVLKYFFKQILYNF